MAGLFSRLHVNVLPDLRRRTEVCNEAPTPYGGDLHIALIIFSALSFLAYGSACFWSGYIKREFDRYRLGGQRTLVGGLQLCAAFGLLAGLNEPWIGRAAAGGLALMMLVAVGVRIKIKDTLLQTLPALFYLALNAYLILAAF